MRTRISSALITLKVMVELAGKTSEWNTVNEQMGVITKAPTAGSKTGPPAEKEYPVEPVSVATIKPSAWQLRIGLPSLHICV